MAEPETRRKRGGQPGNTNRLKHGVHGRAHREQHGEVAALIRESRNLVLRANWFRRAWMHWKKVERERSTSAPCICNPLLLLNFFGPLYKSRIRLCGAAHDVAAGEQMSPVIGDAAEYNRAAKAGDWHSLCDITLKFLHPDLVKLHDLWKSEARQGHPARRTMSPRLFKSVLRDIAYVRTDRHGGAALSRATDGDGVRADPRRPHRASSSTRRAGPKCFALVRRVGRDAWRKSAAQVPRPRGTNQMSFLTGEFFSAPLIADDGEVSWCSAPRATAASGPGTRSTRKRVGAGVGVEPKTQSMAKHR